jgi:hypothetical protein
VHVGRTLHQQLAGERDHAVRLDRLRYRGPESRRGLDVGGGGQVIAIGHDDLAPAQAGGSAANAPAALPPATTTRTSVLQASRLRHYSAGTFS